MTLLLSRLYWKDMQIYSSIGYQLVSELLLMVLWVYLCVLHVLLLFDLWEDLGETCVEVAVEEALVATLDDAFGMFFELFLRHG